MPEHTRRLSASVMMMGTYTRRNKSQPREDAIKYNNRVWVPLTGPRPFDKKGKTGFPLHLDALPLDGRIVLAEPKTDEVEAPPETA